MEPLADPENDRAIKEIIPPPHRPIADDLLYPNKCIIFRIFTYNSFKCA